MAADSGRPSIHLDGNPVNGQSGDGRRFKLNLFSRTASAALFASLALCLVLFCAYSYVARRRAISATRRRFLDRVRDLVSGWSPGPDDVPPPPPPPRVPTACPPPAGASKLPFPAARGANSSPSSGPAGDCPVCLEPLRGGGDVMAAHACGHVFHAPCIQSWLRRRDSCPVCRCTVSCGRDTSTEAGTAAVGGDGASSPPETAA